MCVTKCCWLLRASFHKDDDTLPDFQSVVELEQYLRATYDKVVSGETTGVDLTTQALVTVALHYMKQTGNDNPRVIY